MSFDLAKEGRDSLLLVLLSCGYYCGLLSRSVTFKILQFYVFGIFVVNFYIIDSVFFLVVYNVHLKEKI